MKKRQKGYNMPFLPLSLTPVQSINKPKSKPKAKTRMQTKAKTSSSRRAFFG